LICHSYFSDKHSVRYEFYKDWHFTEISGIKIGGRTLLYRGQTDPWSLTRGARGPLAGHAGAKARAAPTMAGSCRRPRRRRSGTRKGGGRGPTGPGAHQGHSGEVSLAGDGPAAVNSAAVSSVDCESVDCEVDGLWALLSVDAFVSVRVQLPSR
jgi:hypothetical protein